MITPEGNEEVFIVVRVQKGHEEDVNFTRLRLKDRQNRRHIALHKKVLCLATCVSGNAQFLSLPRRCLSPLRRVDNSRVLARRWRGRTGELACGARDTP